MSRTLLYYPTIDIPDRRWLHSSILYADKVASIVPYDIYDSRFPEHLRKLIDEDQYKPFLIETLLASKKREFEEFQEHFVATINSDEFNNELKNEISPSYKQLDTLYLGKMTSRIKRHFEENGLIKDASNDLIVTDEMVSLFYMSVLTQFVTKITKDELIIPSTNDKRYENIGFACSDTKEPAMSFIIENCLPVPADDTPIEKLIEFKKQRRNELLAFRKFLSEVQEKIRKATEEQEVKEIQIDTKEKIEKGINDLVRLSEENSIKTFFTSFESLLKLDNPKLFATLITTGLISTPLQPEIGVVAGLIGIVGGVVSSYYANQREIDKSELSYLFKAKKAEIIS